MREQSFHFVCKFQLSQLYQSLKSAPLQSIFLHVIRFHLCNAFLTGAAARVGQNVAHFAQATWRRPSPTPAHTRPNRSHVYRTRIPCLFHLPTIAQFSLHSDYELVCRQRNMHMLVSKVRAAVGNCGVGVVNPALIDSEGQPFDSSGPHAASTHLKGRLFCRLWNCGL